MWEAILNLVYSWVAWFESFLGDWGLAIIVITIIFRLIISPITVKQTKSTYLMNKMQPQLKEIQTKYADDQMKMAEETQRIYKEAHFNPLSGCLPMLLQMPVFVILFQVLRSLDTRVEEGTVVSLYSLIPDLTLDPMDVVNQSGFVSAIPYFILVLIFAASIIVPSLINKQATEKTTMVMMVIMAVFFAYIGCVSPAGVVLYWDVSSIIGICTTLIFQRKYKREDELKAAAEPLKPVKVDVERREKKPRPRKKSKR